MKINKIIFALSIFYVFVGCKNSSEQSEGILPDNTSTSTPISSFVADSSEQQKTTVSMTSKAALNPAHGQPGHRCDIAVGEPLDSKPTQQTVNATPQQPVTIAPAPIQNVAPVAAAGVNPAHGQPNHRCDIAVGAPLNSKPVQPNINPNPQPSVAPVNADPPPIINLKTGEPTQAGKNPAHGQPGHRCDIAVGAPLNSKPIQ